MIFIWIFCKHIYPRSQSWEKFWLEPCCDMTLKVGKHQKQLHIWHFRPITIPLQAVNLLKLSPRYFYKEWIIDWDLDWDNPGRIFGKKRLNVKENNHNFPFEFFSLKNLKYGKKLMTICLINKIRLKFLGFLGKGLASSCGGNGVWTTLTFITPAVFWQQEDGARNQFWTFQSKMFSPILKARRRSLKFR